nr:MAG TPA: hypothetical protein [Caudoviricetes sp.]DAQ28468.1 MAG TPA: hypothetical protein [Caudoviricetes sp.]
MLSSNMSERYQVERRLYPIWSFLSLSFRLRSPIQPACLTYQPT